MSRTTGGGAKWWLLGLGLVVAVPVFCCCGMFMLGALSPAAPSSSGPSMGPTVPPPPSPSANSTVPAEPSAGSTVPSEVDREPSEPPVVAAEPTVDLPPTEERAVEGDAPGLPGIGATRAHWEATHQRAPGFSPGMAFGPMFLSESGRGSNPTYAAVVGDDRIQHYSVQLPTPGVPFDIARARALRELPPDAREVRTRRLTECRMVHYRSATLRRLFARERHRGDVEVAFFSSSPDVFDSRRVTFLTFAFYFGEDIRC